MNRFDKKTPISQLNREGNLKGAPPDLIKVIEAALNYNKLTNGAFDITITPIINLFRRKFSNGKGSEPSEREIKNTLDLVGSDLIEIKGGDISFKRKGMSITLDGIAKGFAVDMASDVLLSHGITNHLINAGGDILVAGQRLDGKPWRVGIQNPQKGKEPNIIISLTDAAVATSGNYENFFDREKMFHHIINPKTGRSPVVNVSASVIASTAMEADALATSMLVMSPDQGVKFIDSLEGRESLVIERNGLKIKSAGWKSETI
jgi:thiamine biosynthesis lipoprotein